MPRYEVRLESPDNLRDDGSSHFRVTRLVAADEAEARAQCERKEFSLCAYRLPARELARIEKVEADPKKTLEGQDKGRLFAHRQDRPYEVVSVTEVPERG